MLDFTRLRVLAAVAREGSVSAAAASLHYAQPSVSHHLARLEAETGVPLVQRAGRGIRLTEAGRLLADRAEEILGQVESAHAEVAAHAGLRTGRLRLAAFPSAVATIVPPAVARFGSAHPDVGIALVEAEPPEALEALRQGEADVALVFEHADTSGTDRRHVTTTPLLDEPIYVVTPASRTWPGPSADLATYAGERWIAGCERCREHLVGSCERSGFSPVIGFETDDYVAVQALVAAGVGVSTLPGLALGASRNPDVRVEAIPGERRSVLVATYGRSPAPLPVQAFLDVLQASVPSSTFTFPTLPVDLGEVGV
jgi:DNA-binding transcriptional LysR family regulator